MSRGRGVYDDLFLECIDRIERMEYDDMMLVWDYLAEKVEVSTEVRFESTPGCANPFWEMLNEDQQSSD